MTYTTQPGDPWADYDGNLLTVAPIAEQGDPWWTSKAMAAVKQLASLGEPFTVCDITQDPYSVEEPPHANYWGSLAAKARAELNLHEVGRRRSARKASNGRKVALWQAAA